MLQRVMMLAVLSCCVAAWVAGPAWAGEAQVAEMDDTVHLTDNTATNVRIVEDDWRGVKYEVAANVPTFAPVSRVKAVEYGVRPDDFTQATEAMRKGDFTKAEKLLAAGVAKASKRLKPYYLAALVECYEGLNRPEDLRKRASELAGLKPAPRVVYEPYLKIGESYLREGKFVEAEKAFGDARKFFDGLEKTGGLPAGVQPFVKRYRLNAGYMTLVSMGRQAEEMPEGDERKKRLKEVSRAFDRFTPEATGEGHIVDLCRTSVARYDAMAGDEDAFRKLLELAAARAKESQTNPEADEALAAAWVALGDAAFLKLDYEEARWYYLSVIVRCPAGRSNVARAHYMVGQCYEKLGQKVREREAEVRARRHYEAVVKGFPESIEAAAAGKRLKENRG